MIIYAVYASDYESSWIKKAFMSKEKAEAYAHEIRDGIPKLETLMVEHNRRVDEIWDLLHDSNGFNGEHLFEELDAWWRVERKSQNIHPDCEDGDTIILVKELEVEE